MGFCEIRLRRCCSTFRSLEQSIGDTKDTLLESIILDLDNCLSQNSGEICSRNQVIGKVLLSKCVLSTIGDSCGSVGILISRLSHRSFTVIVNLISLCTSVNRNALRVGTNLRIEILCNSTVLRDDTRVHESIRFSRRKHIDILSKCLVVETETTSEPNSRCLSHY